MQVIRSFKMLAYERFVFIFDKCFKFCETVLGYRIRDQNFKVNILTLNTIGMVVSCNIFSFYTIFDNNWKTGIKTGSVVGISLGVK